MFLVSKQLVISSHKCSQSSWRWNYTESELRTTMSETIQSQELCNYRSHYKLALHGRTKRFTLYVYKAKRYV